ncbi:MAG: transglutaminase family protein [Planctomycetota bacterium]
MTIRVALHHETLYQYDRSISIGPQLIRLRPAFHTRTPIDAYSLHVQPDEHFRNWQQDPFGNPIARYVFPNPCTELSITVDLIADMTVINPFDFFIEEESNHFPFRYSDELKHQLSPYLNPSERTPLLDQWIQALPTSADRVVDFLVEVNSRLKDKIEYLVRLEPGVQTPEETLTIGSGSCRDSAWLLVEAFRHLGIAARFVSGYLIQLTADQKSLDGPSGPDEDFCDLHAWTEVFLPGAGWVGLDPTSGLFAGEGHIPLACTPSYTGAAPISGSHEACEVEFHHAMSVTRFHEDPRVTKPYTDTQWESIMRTGRAVDEVLEQQDVRLTMGGEPTFVSIDNMDDPQWNTDAVGEEKRVFSNLLLLRLRDRFAPGGLLHYGQGKWYPGESLPRWALSCLWRRDGEPIWEDPQWLADEGRDYGLTVQDARRFVNHLTRVLNISAKQTFPVYEDTFHYLWKEDRLPIDVDPADPKLDDPNERSMLMRTLRQGLSSPVGFVLPIRRAWWQARPGWIGGRWPVRSGKVFLLPGDSPIGLRLPLDSLPVAGSDTAVLYTEPYDPTIPRPALPTRQEKGNDADALRDEPTWSRRSPGSSGGFAPDAINEQILDEEDDDHRPTSEEIVRTAMCVECRHGRLHVFMPPTQRLEDYLDLVSAVEATSTKLKMPVIIEGYLPPPDDRLEILKVTPDPGVIEVNTHPTESWEALVGLTESLYEDARQCRLGTDKFDLDGRHTGTGGGNHVVLGGKTPSDSPFLRRPDLLGSLIRFWNNHPSLSYLFSSRFIGPTSQAPRVDEGRRDAVYEMEIALSQLPTRDSFCQPWMVDRLFRDLLVDATGNTHRCEICIDKLYSPDSSSGRLGLVELRGFEMPPHARMSLAQQLLIRAAIAAFWEERYQGPIIHWESALHDRFLLPHFVWNDLGDVVTELSRDGIELDLEWFAPHFEFRFPSIGVVTYQDMTLRLRSAIEPWYVMGEEPGGGGTVRYVDSSVERLELKVEGMDPTRFCVLCNGIRIPIHPTGIHGQYVAGIRYRAWQPPRCLHPTIGIHSPLQFEFVDLANQKSIGGCTYHVAEPAGRASDRFPINANEAEARRAARFESIGMTGQTLHISDPPAIRPPQPYPLTLDLRRL